MPYFLDLFVFIFVLPGLSATFSKSSTQTGRKVSPMLTRFPWLVCSSPLNRSPYAMSIPCSNIVLLIRMQSVICYNPKSFGLHTRSLSLHENQSMPGTELSISIEKRNQQIDGRIAVHDNKPSPSDGRQHASGVPLCIRHTQGPPCPPRSMAWLVWHFIPVGFNAQDVSDKESNGLKRLKKKKSERHRRQWKMGPEQGTVASWMWKP